MNEPSQKRKQMSRLAPAVLALALAILTVCVGVNLREDIATYWNTNKWFIIAKIPKAPRQLGETTLRLIIDFPYILYRLKDHGLPVYDIVIDANKLQELNDALPDPKSSDYKNYITDEEKIEREATFFSEGNRFDVDMRYRGLMSNHWLWQKKSIRLTFKDPVYFGTSHKLDLFISRGREYEVEDLNNYRAEKLGLPAPKGWFVWLRVNGVDHGVYYVQDVLDGDYLEKNGLRSDTNLYGEKLARVPIYSELPFSVTEWDKKTVEIGQRMDDMTDLSLLLDIENEPDNIFYTHIWDILDKENFERWYAHTILSGSTSNDWTHNARLYFNKEVGKFQFLPIDVSMDYLDDNALFVNHNPVVTRALGDTIFLRDVETLLWNYVHNEHNLEDDLAHYDAMGDSIRTGLYQDTFDDANVHDIKAHREQFREKIVLNFRKIQRLLSQNSVSLSVSGGDTYMIVTVTAEGNVPVFLDSMILQRSPGADMYEDTNRNGMLDGQDRPADTDQDGAIIIRASVEPTLHIGPFLQEDPLSFEPLSPVPSDLHYFMKGKSNTPFSLTLKGKNEITGEDFVSLYKTGDL